MPRKGIVVLYSGGLDSTLVSAMLARKGYDLHLLTFDNGMSYGLDVSRIHVDELRELFPDVEINHQIRRSAGLFKKMSILPIEEDFRNYNGINMACLGCKTAMFAHAIIYARTHGINLLADGFNDRQKDYPEQKRVVKQEIAEWLRRYGIEYTNPIYDGNDKRVIKAKLFDIGVLPKSIEGACMLGDSFSVPTDEDAVRYVREKIPIGDAYIEEAMRELRSDL